MDVFYQKDLGLIVENLSASDNSLVDSFEGRSINPGHSLEAMWFIMDLGKRLGRPELIQRAVEIALRTIEYGWDKQYGGIFYFMDRLGHPQQQLEWDQKLWWVHIESAIAMIKGYQLTGNQKCLDWFEKLHQYMWEHFKDPRVPRVVRIPEPARRSPPASGREENGRGASTYREVCSRYGRFSNNASKTDRKDETNVIRDPVIALERLRMGCGHGYGQRARRLRRPGRGERPDLRRRRIRPDRRKGILHAGSRRAKPVRLRLRAGGVRRPRRKRASYAFSGRCRPEAGPATSGCCAARATIRATGSSSSPTRRYTPGKSSRNWPRRPTTSQPRSAATAACRSTESAAATSCTWTTRSTASTTT